MLVLLHMVYELADHEYGHHISQLSPNYTFKSNALELRFPFFFFLADEFNRCCMVFSGKFTDVLPCKYQ